MVRFKNLIMGGLFLYAQGRISGIGQSSRRIPPTRVPGAAAVGGNFHSPLCTSAGGFLCTRDLGT